MAQIIILFYFLEINNKNRGESLFLILFKVRVERIDLSLSWIRYSEFPNQSSSKTEDTCHDERVSRIRHNCVCVCVCLCVWERERVSVEGTQMFRNERVGNRALEKIHMSRKIFECFWFLGSAVDRVSLYRTRARLYKIVHTKNWCTKRKQEIMIGIHQETQSNLYITSWREKKKKRRHCIRVVSDAYVRFALPENCLWCWRLRRRIDRAANIIFLFLIFFVLKRRLSHNSLKKKKISMWRFTIFFGFLDTHFFTVYDSPQARWR